MFGQLVDVYSFDKYKLINFHCFFLLKSYFFIFSQKFEYFEEFPLLLLPNFEQVTGRKINSFFLVNYEYGANFSKPGY